MAKKDKENNSKLYVSNIFNENEDGAPSVSGISTFSSPHYFVPPSGRTQDRPQNPSDGMIRFNTDSGHLEYFRGTHWEDVEVVYPQVGVSTHAAGISAIGTGHRGLIAGGYAPAQGDLIGRIEYITISTFGNTANFGDLVAPTRLAAGCSSSTRGLFGGGASPAPTKTAKIDFVTIASAGTAADFGNLSLTRNQLGACSNTTRGLFGGGDAPAAVTNVIDYVTIATTGTISDFGDMVTITEQAASCSSSVRGLWAGGSISPGVTNTIQFITIATTGNAQDFGDLAAVRTFFAGCSNSTRGLFGAGYQNSGITSVNTIEFVIIASTGDAMDFGDLTVARRAGQAACSSPTRGVFAGGQGGPSDAFLNTIDCVEFASTGNAVDFGDMVGTTSGNFGCSNGHGGL